MKRVLPLVFVLGFVSAVHADTWGDVFNGIKAASEVVDLVAKTNRAKAEHSILDMQVQAYRGQVYSNRQDEWNHWNGLVSLMSAEQKQDILKLNTTSDKELAAVWFAVYKATSSFPGYLLMPTKRDSLSNYVFTFWTNQENIQDYLGYAKNALLANRKELWRFTRKDIQEEIKAKLKARKKNYEIDAWSDFVLYKNYCEDLWDEKNMQHDWKAYLKQLTRIEMEKQTPK